MIAAVVGNRKDQELDIILVSAKDGQFIRNLTKGFDKDRGFEYIATAGGLRGNLVPWIAVGAESATGIAYFARTEKDKTLVIQNVVTGKIEQTIRAGDASTARSRRRSAPTAARSSFAALAGRRRRHLHGRPRDRRQSTNLTKDPFADYAPTYSPDGKSIVYTARISGNDKLFQVDLATGAKKQLTFGTHDDTAAKFYDDHTLVFTSTAIDPERRRCRRRWRATRNIPNVWTLDLQQRRAPAVDRHGDRQRLAGRPAQRRRAARRLRLVLQGRERHPRDHRRQADRHGRLGGLRRARRR